MSESVIETQALRKQFGSTLAVESLSLSVRKGEVFGFLGPNGAGKTTSIKMLLSLIQPTSGKADLLGVPVGDRAARGRIGFLPEHFRFHDCLSGRELLRFHGRLYGRSGFELESRIDTLLARVDLLDAADRPLRGYSKGMLQRAGLAQALINDPLLVFLDEPTSGLDPLGRFLVRDIISELRANGTSVFLNSHLLGEVEATCDRVAFVKHGRVVRELTLSEATPKLDVELVAEPLSDSVLDGLRQFAIVAERAADGKVRLLVARESAIPEIVRWLVSRNVNIHAVHSRPKSLEEWFLEVMGDDQRPG